MSGGEFVKAVAGLGLELKDIAYIMDVSMQTIGRWAAMDKVPRRTVLSLEAIAARVAQGETAFNL